MMRISLSISRVPRRLVLAGFILLAGCSQFASQKLLDEASKDVADLKVQYEVLLKSPATTPVVVENHRVLMEKALERRDAAFAALREETEKSRSFWATTWSVVGTIIITIGGAALVAL